MAYRKQARIPAALWDDEAFIRLDRCSQWLYLMLLTSPDMDSAGVQPLMLRRWARRCADVVAEELLGPLRTLSSSGYVCSDEETEEVFVSGYYASERIALQPRRVIGVIDALNRTASDAIKAFASAELADLVKAAPAPPAPRGIRAEILERDGWKCRGCSWRPGDPVPTKLGRPIYRGLEIDHIHPKSKGGSDEAENFQVLCTSCNASKGARV